MSCYFIISVFLEPGKDRADYDDYINGSGLLWKNTEEGMW